VSAGDRLQPEARVACTPTERRQSILDLSSILSASDRREEVIMKDGIIRVADGRSVGYADYGMPDQIPLLWCHGAPSNRLEASFVAEAAARAGLRIIGTIGQGTGGRRRSRGAPSAAGSPTGLRSSITSASTGLSWVGASTGGAYALAVASSSPRVMCAVACCAVSDMRWPEGKAMNVSCHPVWHARDREDALAIVTAAFGAHGENLLPPRPPLGAPPSDVKLYDSPSFVSWETRYLTEVFTQGPEGYVDDRLADANGWSTSM
jgi:hypothetical protein